MKNSRYLLWAIVALLLSCETAGDPKLLGEWEIIEFRIIGPGGDATSDKETLDDAGAKWDLNFSRNGDFEQSFNMRKPTMEMESEQGTWKTSGDSLLITLHIDTIKSELNYKYKINEDIVTLTLAPEQADSKIITKFKKK